MTNQWYINMNAYARLLIIYCNFFVFLAVGCKQKALHTEQRRIGKLIAKGYYLEASKIADSLIATNKNDGMGYFNKGVILNYMQRFHEAIPYFKRSFELNYQPLISADMIKSDEQADSLIRSFNKTEKP